MPPPPANFILKRSVRPVKASATCAPRRRHAAADGRPGADAIAELGTHRVRAHRHRRARRRARAAPGRPPQRLAYKSQYLHLTPRSRIVYTYTSHVDDVPHWTSLDLAVTIELHPEADGTHLRWTEQAAFLTPSAQPEHDFPHLRGATRLRLNGLTAALRTQTPCTERNQH